MGHSDTGHTHASTRNPGCNRSTSRQTDSTSLLHDSSGQVPHLIRLQLKTYSQAVVLMLQEKLNSNLASALPKLPSLH